jgi:hypothetical protein
MQKEKYDFLRKWQPTAIAPQNIDLEISIYDGGEYHALAFPVRRHESGWHDIRANRALGFEPTHWRPWYLNRV